MVGRRMVDRWTDDNKMFLALNIKKRVLPAIYGGIIGDLMGVPVEFKQRGTFCIQDIVGYGTYNQPPGTWSDDTSLTLCLVENIMENGNLKSLMQKFVQYKEEGYWTPFGMMFDIGRTTSDAITRFKEAVLKAVNLGGDTDTVAAITGTLAGMYYKMDGIPEEWLEKIVRKQDIDELIRNFYKFCADKAIIEEYGSL
ncbi:hypothetical protein COM11_05735 [Bacillus pseudomycoides]|uniref:ADP-ribosylglycohydrolase family protein n=1 Tax=Bacillus pseudomycoides TaxID=64104 RepID=UPI000BF851C8|nr:ADP-ribosylglycohydrolase family protein [Bacillus pseudomycoides]PGC32663.1 hypothetical protein COM11_05735 [Bacillus pseudomycoides]